MAPFDWTAAPAPWNTLGPEIAEGLKSPVVRDGLEDAGYGIILPRTPDEDLRAAWSQILCVLRIAEDLAHAGARLRIETEARYDPLPYLKSGVARMVETILANAEVVRREAIDA